MATKNAENRVPDWIPPTTEERNAANYVAVRNGIDLGRNLPPGKKPHGGLTISQWCEREGLDEEACLRMAVRMGKIDPCVLDEFVREQSAKAYLAETPAHIAEACRDKRFDNVTVTDVLLHEVEKELDAFAEAEGDDEVPGQTHRGRGRSVRKP